MPYHADNPYLALRMAEAKHVIGFAMGRKPEDYYKFIERPGLRRLSEKAGLYTGMEYSQKFGIESNALDLFATGINDTIKPFTSVIQHEPELTKEQSLAIMANPITIATYGLLASMTQAGLHRIYREDPDLFTLSEDGSAIVLTHSIRKSHNHGCEAVDARNVHPDHNPHPEMLPLFKKFVPWAGSLAVLAYFEYNHPA